MRKVILPASIVIGLSLLACYTGLVNPGLPFGYYGQLNKVKARLEAIPNLKIRRVRGNYDITLEDFTFDLTIMGQYDASLYLHEPPSPSWQLFDTADGFRVRCAMQRSFDNQQRAHHSWTFALGPDAALERELGHEMRNLHDVFTHFADIMQLINTTPIDHLGAQRTSVNAGEIRSNLVVTIPCPAPKSE